MYFTLILILFLETLKVILACALKRVATYVIYNTVHILKVPC